MSRIRQLMFLIPVLGSLTATVSAQVTHDIVLEGDPAAGRFRFNPSRITAATGDLLRFVVSGGQPHVIAFEGSRLSVPVRAALDAALLDRMSDLRGALLLASGSVYRMTVPQIPPGDYIFFCLPHLSYGMTGVLTVTEGKRGRSRP